MTGIVDYTSYDDMKYAIRKLDRSEFRNAFSRSYVRVREYDSRRSYSRSPSRSPYYSRSRSRSPYYSRSRSPSRSWSYSPRSRSFSPRGKYSCRSPSLSPARSASQYSPSGSPPRSFSSKDLTAKYMILIPGSSSASEWYIETFSKKFLLLRSGRGGLKKGLIDPGLGPVLHCHLLVAQGDAVEAGAGAYLDPFHLR
ncbi:hypothetical protein CUMW_179550 [Citrus unshiu]|uniref:RRM domain-containing protein n=1 Tax=Citrus unshiu TaxID=55188 RepID=A0A2H5PYM5_CITUN|nr:hypothetical protein CUMW_179550 [Citrus unshiu]